MSPVTKALWYIETHFGNNSLMDLDTIADAAGVSRFHLSRAFASAFGYTVIRYVRGRRLTEAARMLAAGAPDILAVALEAGYASHEAFTRAFREEFGCTPEDVRERRALTNLNLLEPIRMCQSPTLQLVPPTFVEGKEMLFAGISEHYTAETSAGIPAQWMRFGPFIGNIRGQKGDVAYGVICNADDVGGCNYLCGVEINSEAGLPKELIALRIPAQQYAVFAHPGHVSDIRQVFASIWTSWVPESGYQTTGGPALERYPETFDPRTGNGGFEIWVPVRKSP